MANALYNTEVIASLAADAVDFPVDQSKLIGALDAHIGRIAAKSTVKSAWKESKKHGNGIVTRQAITTAPDNSEASKLLLWGETVRMADISGAILRPIMADTVVKWLKEKFTAEVKPKA